MLVTGINYYIIPIQKGVAPIKKELLLFKLFLVHAIHIHTGITCTTQIILHLDPRNSNWRNHLAACLYFFN